MVSGFDVSIKLISKFKKMLRFSNYTLFNHFSYYDISVYEVRKLIDYNKKSNPDHPLLISKQLEELISYDKLRIQANNDEKNANEDEKEAFELIEKLADKGNVESQCHLAFAYENGKGTEKDLKKAFNWYQK